MKILEIVPRLHCGGAERFVVDLAGGIARTGEHEVSLLCVNRILPGDFLARQLDPRVKLICLEAPETMAGAILAMPLVWNVIRRERPDVVHTHLGGIQLAALAEFAHWPHARYFYTVHNDAFVDAGNRLWLKKILFHSGVRPVAISVESERSFVSAYGFHAPIIENGCGAAMPAPEELSAVAEEVRSWRSTPESRLFLNIARFSPQKNQIAQARAAAALAAEGADFDLVFIGNDNDQDIRSAILSLNCPRLHIAGLRSNPLVYLAQADFLALFSVIEGLPITLLESFALGIPPCVTPVGGMKNLVHDGINGLVSEDTSEDAIRKTLKRALALDPAERARLGEGARAAFAPYSMERCVERYLKLMSISSADSEN